MILKLQILTIRVMIISKKGQYIAMILKLHILTIRVMVISKKGQYIIFRSLIIC